MSSPREARWLRGELPGLVAAGVISDETARALEQHYAARETGSSRGIAFVLLAVVGSALVAAGIVLLVAHNWDELSRPARSVIAFLPLVLAQALSVFVLLRRNDSQPWRECAATFNVAGIGTAIALVSQTYQIHGSFADFILTWLLLALPLVYLMRTTVCAMMYAIGAAVWLFHTDNWFSHHQSPLQFWLLLLLLVPYCAIVFRRNRTSRETTAFLIVLAIALAFGVGFTSDYTNTHLAELGFSGLFSLIYICGIEFLQPRESDRLHPLTVLAGVAIGVTTIILTFQDVWMHTNRTVEIPDFSHGVAIAIELLFPLAAVALAVWSFIRRRTHFSILAVGLPIVAAAGWLIVHMCVSEQTTWSVSRCDLVASLMFNLYALALGVELIARGLRADSAARTNFGLVLIAALATARFFDSDFSFVTRAIAFILIGVGFLFTNFLLFKKRRAA